MCFSFFYSDCGPANSVPSYCLCNYVGRYLWNTPWSWFINRFLLFSLLIPYRWITFTCKYAAVIYINKPQSIQKITTSDLRRSAAEKLCCLAYIAFSIQDRETCTECESLRRSESVCDWISNVEESSVLNRLVSSILYLLVSIFRCHPWVINQVMLDYVPLGGIICLHVTFWWMSEWICTLKK